MNWQQYIDSVVGEKESFTNKEVRDMILNSLKFECDSWVLSSK